MLQPVVYILPKGVDNITRILEVLGEIFLEEYTPPHATHHITKLLSQSDPDYQYLLRLYFVGET